MGLNLNESNKINIEIAFFMIIHSIINPSLRYKKTKLLLKALSLINFTVRLQPELICNLKTINDLYDTSYYFIYAFFF